MKRRCYNPNAPEFEYYGARGITVWPDWHSFTGFLDWALETDFEPGKQVDRVDADGPYSPANCRWVWPGINRGRMELDRKGEYLSSLAGKLTQHDIETAAVTGVGYKLTDGGGLYLWVSRLGAKSWRYRFRLQDREYTLTIGSIAKFSIWDAREFHAIAKARVKRGMNPALMKRAAKRRRAT